MAYVISWDLCEEMRSPASQSMLLASLGTVY